MSRYKERIASPLVELALEYDGAHFYLEGHAPNPYEIKNLRLEGKFLVFDHAPTYVINTKYIVWSGHKAHITYQNQIDVTDVLFRTHLAMHTRVRVEYNEYYGDIYLTKSGENVIVSTFEATKMNTPANPVIVADYYLQFPRVANDYDPSDTASAFYYLYWNDGDKYRSVSVNGPIVDPNTKVSFNLQGEIFFPAEQEVTVITHGRNTRAHSDPLVFKIRKTANGKFQIIPN